MGPLTAHDIVRVWEQGQRKPLWYRALLLLSPALPQTPYRDLAALSVGRRNAYLFALRERTFGSSFSMLDACPQCDGALEFTLEARDLCPAAPHTPVEQEYKLTVEGVEVRFRLLTSQDLAAIAGSHDITMARRLLIHRCIVQAADHRRTLQVDDLPESVLTALAESMSDCDPQAEVPLVLECPSCEHTWMTLFDIVSFFWTEVAAQAQRLLHEVHTLAHCYGWQEADILAMSAMRRHFYLEMTS
jgi:hypothetical protein